MRPMKFALMLPVIALSLPGCEKQDADGPPSIRLGDSLCVQCNMIICDARWATATVVDGPRGPEPRLFDDFNCQVNYEIEHPKSTVHSRWSHCHATRQWIRTEDAHFVSSPRMRTPMASRVAAFTSTAEAEPVRSDLGGELMTFKEAWHLLGYSGPCCQGDVDEEQDS